MNNQQSSSCSTVVIPLIVASALSSAHGASLSTMGANMREIQSEHFFLSSSDASHSSTCGTSNRTKKEI
jgi:hypothetical protein